MQGYKKRVESIIVGEYRGTDRDTSNVYNVEGLEQRNNMIALDSN